MRADVRERATSETSTSGWGAGNVRNRRLVHRLVGSDEWDEFDSKVAAARCRADSATRTCTAPTTVAASSGCRFASSTRD